MRYLLWVLAAILVCTFTFPFLVLLMFSLALLVIWWGLGVTLGLAYWTSMKLDTPENNLTIKEAISYRLYSVYCWAYNSLAPKAHKRKAPEYPLVIEILRGFY